MLPFLRHNVSYLVIGVWIGTPVLNTNGAKKKIQQNHLTHVLVKILFVVGLVGGLELKEKALLQSRA